MPPDSKNRKLLNPKDDPEFFEFVVENAADEVYLMKSNSQIVYVNLLACDRLGYARDELLGKYIWEWNPLVQREDWPAYWQIVKENGYDKLETQHRAKTGRIFPVEIHAHYYVFDGVEYNLAFVHDITERKNAEQKILDYQAHLEEMIEQRTAELKVSNEKLARLVRIDGLTNILNRRAFDESFISEWQRLSRSGDEMSLLLIDIDYFKAYNDHYGHPQGDECLIQVAQLLKDCMHRSSDLVARYGGEEFVCLLPGTGIDGALQIAQSMQEQLEKLALQHEASSIDSRVTLSIGVASCRPKNCKTSIKLISAADECLYEAKRSGRNSIKSRYHLDNSQTQAEKPD